MFVTKMELLQGSVRDGLLENLWRGVGGLVNNKNTSCKNEGTLCKKEKK